MDLCEGGEKMLERLRAMKETKIEGNERNFKNDQQGHSKCNRYSRKHDKQNFHGSVRNESRTPIL